jgi:hypothetical protein
MSKIKTVYGFACMKPVEECSGTDETLPPFFTTQAAEQ